jgi:hypothetical protein
MLIVMVRRSRFIPVVLACCLWLIFLPACGPSYQRIQPRVAKQANQLPNSKTRAGVSVALQQYVYSGEGLNYIEAGIMPVKVVVTNFGNLPMRLSPNQVLAYGSDGQLYLTYTAQEAAQLVINSNAIEEAAKGAVAGAAGGAALGALLGLAVGAIFNVDVGQTAAAGAIGGALGGGAGGIQGTLERLRREVSADVVNNALKESVVSPGFTVSGWLYFPGHVQLREVRMALAAVGGGPHQAFRIKLPPMPKLIPRSAQQQED